MSTHAVSVLDVVSGRTIPAELHDELSAGTLLDIETQWAPVRSELRQKLTAARVPRSQWPQSLHWNWLDKSLMLSLCKQPDTYRIFGIRRQTIWEGAMLTLKNDAVARLAPDNGKSIILVDYLEVAPWNWTIKAVNQSRKFKAIGPVLFRAAVAQSLAEGCDGRLGLHALPQAEAFYLGQGLQLVEYDAAKRLNYFELTASAAELFERG